MPLATCLVNEDRTEFYRLYEYSSAAIQEALGKIERCIGWDVCNHNIYICLFNNGLLDYVDLTCNLTEISQGGEIIHERISLI